MLTFWRDTSDNTMEKEAGKETCPARKSFVYSFQPPSHR